MAAVTCCWHRVPKIVVTASSSELVTANSNEQDGSNPSGPGGNHDSYACTSVLSPS
jgi:hypothetical protein